MATENSAGLPFLQDDEACNPKETLLKKPAAVTLRANLVLAILYVPAILLYVFFYLHYFHFQSFKLQDQCIVSADVQSPVYKSGNIEFEKKKFLKDFRDSEFAGDPSPELDLAWHNLFEDNNVKVDKNDLDLAGLKSVQLANGGYIAQLNVFHELHCLKKIRHWIFKDYYVLPKNYTEAELKEWPAHINHCIDMLRESIMCLGDTSLVTFTWIGDGKHRTPTPWDRSSHKCVKWDSLTRWTKERSVNIETPGILLDEQGSLYPRNE
ncbi:hypothetical protein HYALB_00009691 [Hymenoscyphus albidus]|uniref:Tat pathway signal sequence protein n=1 Tax=Hymenoscyphus albidus TaxID=595503 RepID=A0A9N9LDK4_9HELO|nr:hypothetical protein HYALB_00009691 [Hymenoscyphus albidus]